MRLSAKALKGTPERREVQQVTASPPADANVEAQAIPAAVPDRGATAGTTGASAAQKTPVGTNELAATSAADAAWARIRAWEQQQGLKADEAAYAGKSSDGPGSLRKQMLHGEIEFPGHIGHRCKYLICPPNMETPEDILVHMFSKNPQIKNGWRLSPPSLVVYGVGSRGDIKQWIHNVKPENLGVWGESDGAHPESPSLEQQKNFFDRIQEISSGICQAVVACGGWFDFGSGGRGSLYQAINDGLKVHWQTKGALAGHKSDTVVYAVRNLSDTAFQELFLKNAVPVDANLPSSGKNRVLYPSVSQLIDSQDTMTHADTGADNKFSQADVKHKVYDKFLQQALTHIVFCQNDHLRQHLRSTLENIATRAVIFAGGDIKLIQPGVEGQILHAAIRGNPVVCLNYTGHAVDALCQAILNRRKGVRNSTVTLKDGTIYNLPDNISDAAFTVLSTPADTVEKVIDKLTLVLSTVQDDEMREVGYTSAEEARLDNAWKLRDLFRYNAERQQGLARRLFYVMAVLVLTLSAVSLIYEEMRHWANDFDELCPGEKATAPPHPWTIWHDSLPDWLQTVFPAEPKTMVSLLHAFSAVLPLATTFVLTLTSRFSPTSKMAILEHAQQDIVSEIFQYRTRVGADYMPRKLAQVNIMARIEDYLLMSPPGSGGEASAVRSDDTPFGLASAQLAYLQRVAQQRRGKRVHTFARAATRRECFARNIEDIHSMVLNSELDSDFLVAAPAGYTEKLYLERFDSERNRTDSACMALSTGDAQPLLTAGDAALSHVKIFDHLRDDGISPVTAEDYVRFRLEPQLARFNDLAPWLGVVHRTLQVLTFVLTGVTAAMAIFGLNGWIPFVITLVTVIKSILEFEMVATRLRNVNASQLALKNLHTWWFSLSMVEKRFPANKEFLVRITEGTRDTEVSAWMKGGKDAMKKPPLSGDTNEEADEDDAKCDQTERALTVRPPTI